MPERTATDLPWQSELLERALSLQHNAHLPHAILLHANGESDIGDFIHRLVSLLLCDAPQQHLPCNHCEACRLMRAGTYPDFKWIAPEVDEKTKKSGKTIKIEQIRSLIHDLALTAQYQRLKIAVLYPAEVMSIAGANALLKTLEEPAAQVLIILATHNQGRIPVTLRSRCQSWTLPRPSTVEALTWLADHGLADASATQYLSFAKGDPILALELRQQDYSEAVDRFKPRLARFVRDDLSVSDLCRDLASESGRARRLIFTCLDAYCLRTSGIDADAIPVGDADRPRARDLFELRQRAQNQLQIEQNNLDFQLQLEDVLISLKQILTRRTV